MLFSPESALRMVAGSPRPSGRLSLVVVQSRVVRPSSRSRSRRSVGSRSSRTRFWHRSVRFIRCPLARTRKGPQMRAFLFSAAASRRTSSYFQAVFRLGVLTSSAPQIGGCRGARQAWCVLPSITDGGVRRRCRAPACRCCSRATDTSPIGEFRTCPSSMSDGSEPGT